MIMSLINCPECEKEISEHARWCPQCGYARKESAPIRAHVTDIEMSFGSMFVFMLKWAFASIPALIVLFMLIAGLSVAFFGTHARI